MENKEKCDCTVGFIDGKLLYESTFVTQMIWIVQSQPYINVNKVMDLRRGILNKFNFCPKCGQPINWKHLAKSLKNEYEHWT